MRSFFSRIYPLPTEEYPRPTPLAVDRQSLLETTSPTLQTVLRATPYTQTVHPYITLKPYTRTPLYGGVQYAW
jgi:hypothetical protein